MAQTVIGLFDDATSAQNAVQALLSNGFNRDHIDVSNIEANDSRSTTDNYYTGSSTSGGSGTGDSISNFFSSLFGGDDTSSRSYTEVARNSNAIVTVHAPSEDLAHNAAQILDNSGAIDVDERYSQQYGSTQTGANNLTSQQTAQQRTRADGDVSIPVVEENLQLGKREVETGGVRLRSRIFERPVEESVRLREERVFVNRQPVDRDATEADFQTFKEGEIELTERAEVPIVNKEARVVEEISVGKEVGERTETVQDTVRKTDVEVEEIDSTDTRRRAANS
jgi:uncharacterized protein (TIGR02271 family)